MSKFSIIQKEKNRFFLYNKYIKKYNFLKTKIKEYYKKGKFFNNLEYTSFQRLPKNSNPTRIRNRCYLTGRPRGVFRTFGLSRSVIRELSFKGFIPGLFKSCW